LGGPTSNSPACSPRRNGGKFFVLCFQPVTFPCALCAQVTRASAPRVVQLPIHPRVRLADNGGKFFVLCFQPVTFPCALCAQVTRASARVTMATADSRSARDRHWKSRALRTPCTIQAHSPRSGNRQARPRPGLALEDLHLKTGCAPRARCFCTVVSVAVARAPVWSKLPAPERERQISGREIYS
jgi:hypothetical protein